MDAVTQKLINMYEDRIAELEHEIEEWATAYGHLGKERDMWRAEAERMKADRTYVVGGVA